MPKQTPSPARRYTPVDVRNRTKVFRFGSGEGPTQRILSNFHRSPLTLRESDFEDVVLKRFPVLAARFAQVNEGVLSFLTSEAAWQALKARNVATFARFEVDGDIGKEPTPADFLRTLTGKNKTQEKAAKKHTYWIKRRNCPGIFPKLAVNDSNSRRKALGFASNDLSYPSEYLAPDIEKSAWMSILRSKARTDSVFADLLKEKKGYQFVEFERRAKHTYLAGTRSESHWAGYDDGDKIYGGNRMGVFMEELSGK